MNNYIKYLFCLLALLALIGTVSSTRGQNSFTGREDTDKLATQYRSPKALLDRLTLLQNQAREKIATLVKESKKTRSLRPMASLILFSLIYGIIHAAGPGHGKVVAFSYILSTRPNYLKGLVFGNLVALFHGLGGILVVMVVYCVLHIGVFKSMERITNITQIVSYSLIICLGLSLLLSVLWEWRKKRQPFFMGVSETGMGENISAALIIGIIPCPGVIMVTLLAISMDLPALGILLGVCISLGMAISVTAVVIAGVAGKKALIRCLGSNSGQRQWIEHAIRAASGFLVTTLGTLLLLSELVSAW